MLGVFFLCLANDERSHTLFPLSSAVVVEQNNMCWYLLMRPDETIWRQRVHDLPFLPLIFFFSLTLVFLLLCHCKYRCPVWSPSCIATPCYLYNLCLHPGLLSTSSVVCLGSLVILENIIYWCRRATYATPYEPSSVHLFMIRWLVCDM